MRRSILPVGVAVACLAAASAQAAHFSPWGEAVKLDTVDGNHADVNTAALDGCPIESPDGRHLYMASNRPGGQGGLDVWVAHRDRPTERYGAPENLGPGINSAADDFCPTPVHGGGLFFVSRRADAGACGMGDIFYASRHPVRGWTEPERLACAPAGPNSALDEQGPSVSGSELYFSRSSATVAGDVFASPQMRDGEFGPAEAVAELNAGSANDIQPNLGKDGREVVFSSNRADAAAKGGQDVYMATRRDRNSPWSAPVNAGGGVNTAAAETRPSLSWHADRLLFGRAPGPEGMADIYLAERDH